MGTDKDTVLCRFEEIALQSDDYACWRSSVRLADSPCEGIIERYPWDDPQVRSITCGKNGEGFLAGYETKTM
jgi:hypothetical protein